MDILELTTKDRWEYLRNRRVTGKKIESALRMDADTMRKFWLQSSLLTSVSHSRIIAMGAVQVNNLYVPLITDYATYNNLVNDGYLDAREGEEEMYLFIKSLFRQYPDHWVFISIASSNDLMVLVLPEPDEENVP